MLTSMVQRALAIYRRRKKLNLFKVSVKIPIFYINFAFRGFCYFVKCRKNVKKYEDDLEFNCKSKNWYFWVFLKFWPIFYTNFAFRGLGYFIECRKNVRKYEDYLELHCKLENWYFWVFLSLWANKLTLCLVAATSVTAVNARRSLSIHTVIALIRSEHILERLRSRGQHKNL